MPALCTSGRRRRTVASGAWHVQTVHMLERCSHHRPYADVCVRVCVQYINTAAKLFDALGPTGRMINVPFILAVVGGCLTFLRQREFCTLRGGVNVRALFVAIVLGINQFYEWHISFSFSPPSPSAQSCNLQALFISCLAFYLLAQNRF